MSYWDTEIGPGKRTFKKFRKSLNSTYASRLYVAGRLKEMAPGSVLDVGCGLGDDYNLYRKMGLGFSYYGIDACEQFIEENKRIFPGVTLKVGDIRSLHFKDGAFDVVTCRSVLEHLPDPYPAIKEMGRVARDRIIITWHSPPKKIDRVYYSRRRDLWRNKYSRRRIKAVLYDCNLKLIDWQKIKTNEVWEIVHA